MQGQKRLSQAQSSLSQLRTQERTDKSVGKNIEGGSLPEGEDVFASRCALDA